MKLSITQLSVLTALLLQGTSMGAGYAAESSAAHLFQISELPGMASGGSMLLAEKCGSGSCGGKDHKDSDKAHCGSKKGEDHHCGGKDHKDSDKQHCGSKKDDAHKCGSGSCGSKAPAAAN